MTDLDKLVERLSELLERATPGPWEYAVVADALRRGMSAAVEDGRGGVELIAALYDREYEADAALIVEAINSLPALLEAARAIKELREENEQLERALRIRIWNECRGRGVRDADAYKHIEGEITRARSLLSGGE